MTTKAIKLHHEKLRELGCSVCGNHAALHHCLTGGGGRKNDWLVTPLCFVHHQGSQGMHTLSRKIWQAQFGHEWSHMMKNFRAIGFNPADAGITVPEEYL